MPKASLSQISCPPRDLNAQIEVSAERYRELAKLASLMPSIFEMEEDVLRAQIGCPAKAYAAKLQLHIVTRPRELIGLELAFANR